MCRQTVWKEMVEKERRKGDVRVQSAAGGVTGWWARFSTIIALAASIVLFIILLGKHHLTPSCF